MLHLNEAGGESAMHVDHFNPTLSGKKRNHYTNLMLASAHCNLRKSSTWPSWSKRSKGLRFLNCTEEQDYGQHVFEDRRTGRLYGSTPAGRFHIEMLDLNSPHLCYKRKQRTELRLLNNNVFVKLPLDRLAPQTRTWAQLVGESIPEIKSWSGAVDPDGP
ncbi:MAG: hypothetical protein QOH31_3351 [Verrucomicrobiota bacterium]|jgi:hypothetical protein